MTPQPYHPLAYDDADSAAQMHADAAAAAVHLPRRRSLAEAAIDSPPSILFEDYTELPKRTISISEATARLAASLHLHLD